MAEARHHHHIPQCYLRSFAIGSGKKCKLSVAVIKSRQVFVTNPRNVAGIRDFNRIEVDGLKPDAVEGMLSNLEGEVATAIRNVAGSHKFEGDDKITILNLVALLSVRSPQQRENWRQFEEKVMKQIMSLSLATKKRWESQLKKMKETGFDPDHELPYEQLKEFHDKDQYKIVLNNEHHLGLEFKGFDVVLRTLVDRKWALYTTTEEVGLFITADRPVVLRWNDPQKIPPMMRWSPGHGMRETELVFPLTPHLLLVGEFDGEEGTFPALPAIVALINSRMFQFAFEQVYMRKRNITYMTLDGEIHHDRNYFERFAQDGKSLEELRAKQKTDQERGSGFL